MADGQEGGGIGGFLGKMFTMKGLIFAAVGGIVGYMLGDVTGALIGAGGGLLASSFLGGDSAPSAPAATPPGGNGTARGPGGPSLGQFAGNFSPPPTPGMHGGQGHGGHGHG
jgi:hypothetical protein